MSSTKAAEPKRRGRAIGHISRSGLHRGLASSFADALRDGVRLERVDLSRLPRRSLVGARDEASAAVRSLEAHIASLTTEIDACFLRQGRADDGSEDEALERAEGSRLKRERAEAEAQLVELRRIGTARVASVGNPVLETHMLQVAINALLSQEGQVSAEIVSALDDVLAELTIDEGPGEWRCAATWVLPLVDGVARVGPIPFAVEMPARRSSAAVRENLGERATTKLSSQADIELLESLGATELAAKAVLDSPIKMLLPAVVAALSGRALPPDTHRDWRAPEFQDWLAHIYGDKNFSWSHGYALVSYTEQAIINALIDLGGAGDGRDICQLVPRMTNARLTADRRADRRTWSGTTDLAWAVEYLRQPPAGDRGRGGRYSLTVCSCGRNVAAALAVPEVPRRLLCTCGAMPDADLWGAPAGLKFPAEYLNLAPTREQIAAYQAREIGARTQICLGATQRRILALEGFRSKAEMSTPDIAAAIGRSECTTVISLRALYNNGLVTKRRQPVPEGRIGQLPRMWSVVGDPLRDVKYIEMAEWDAGAK